MRRFEDTGWANVFSVLVPLRADDAGPATQHNWNFPLWRPAMAFMLSPLQRDRVE